MAIITATIEVFPDEYLRGSPLAKFLNDWSENPRGYVRSVLNETIEAGRLQDQLLELGIAIFMSAIPTRRMDTFQEAVVRNFIAIASDPPIQIYADSQTLASYQEEVFSELKDFFDSDRTKYAKRVIEFRWGKRFWYIDYLFVSKFFKRHARGIADAVVARLNPNF